MKLFRRGVEKELGSREDFDKEEEKDRRQREQVAARLRGIEVQVEMLGAGVRQPRKGQG